MIRRGFTKVFSKEFKSVRGTRIARPYACTALWATSQSLPAARETLLQRRDTRQLQARQELERGSTARRNVRNLVRDAGRLDGFLGIAAAYHGGGARCRHRLGHRHGSV